MKLRLVMREGDEVRGKRICGMGIRRGNTKLNVWVRMSRELSIRDGIRAWRRNYNITTCSCLDHCTSMSCFRLEPSQFRGWVVSPNMCPHSLKVLLGFMLFTFEVWARPLPCPEVSPYSVACILYVKDADGGVCSYWLMLSYEEIRNR